MHCARQIGVTMRNAWFPSLTIPALACLCCAGFAGEPATEADEPPAVTWGDYKVEVNERGTLGRIFLKRGYDEVDTMLERAEASGVEPNVWRVALVLVPTFDVTWKDRAGQAHRSVAKLTPEQMDNARASFRKLSEFASAFTGGHLKFASTEFVFPEPVVLTTDPEQKGFFFPPPLVQQMIESFPDWRPEEFDSVICIFPPGDMPMDAFGRSWGQLHGKLKAGNANIAYVAERIGPDAGMAIVMQHEWLHQVESVMMDNLGYFGLPNLHDAGLCGYGPTDLDQPSWLAWNRDFMFRLYRPAMWHKADMNSRSWGRPAPKSEGGYIRRWLVRGPFPNAENAGLDVDFLDGEAEVLPAASEAAAFPVEDHAAWHVFDTAALDEPLPEDATDEQRLQRADREEIVDFARAFKPNTDSVAYAHVYLRAMRTQEALLWIGSDDGVKVFWDGLMVHRNRVDRGVTKDFDCVPIVIKRGWNRLLIKVDQGKGGWGFSARFSTKDGQPVKGLTAALELPEGAKVQAGTAVPVAWDGKLYAWHDVQDDPWAKLPRLDETMLRAMTGLEGLSLEADFAVLRVDPGRTSRAVSPVLREMGHDDARLNNQLTFANESLAWLRYRTMKTDDRFTHDRRDLLFVRWDVIDPWMSWLRSRSAVPADKSLAGYVAIDKQVAYVVYTDLGDTPPGQELDLVSLEGGGVVASVALERAESLTAKVVRGRFDLENTSAEQVTLKRIAVECEAAGVRPIVKSPITNATIDPGGDLATVVPLLEVAPDAEPGVKLARVRLDLATPDGPVTLEKWVALRVMQPVGVQLVVHGPGIIRSGMTRAATLVLTNNASHLGKVAWKVTGKGVKAEPASSQFVLRPVPKVTTSDLTLTFRKAKRTGYADLLTTLDVAERTVPDSRSSLRVHIGARDALLRCDFEKDLDGWRKRAGVYSIEHVRDGAMRGKGCALIKDGGGSKYGSVVIFGPAEGEEDEWDLAYSSDEYPMLEFKIAAKDTGNTAVIVQADGEWYALVLTGEFVEKWGTRKELGNLGLKPDGEVHAVTFDLDEALDKVAGEGDHAVEQIWIGDTKSHSSNQWRGPDIGTILIDDFVIR